MNEFRTAGRIVGLLLVLLIVGGAVSGFVLTGPVFAPPGFLVNAAAHPLNMSLSVLAGLATGVITLGIAITAFPVIRRHGGPLALWLIGIAIASFALGAAEQVANLSLLSLSNAYVAVTSPDEALFQALRGVVAAARNGAHYVHVMVSGSVLLIFFIALFRFALVPRVFAGLGILASLLQMTAVAMPLFGQPVVFPLLAPLGLVVLATSVWLIIRGFSDSLPTNRSNAEVG